ncbi:MAG: hypothetical protein LUG52_05510 [Clostridia bacterium]|nr:hypothetical protein [Clostridia bacterium]
MRGRFKRQYLTFNGKSSKDFLLYLSAPGIYNSPSPDVEATSIPGLNGDLIQNNAKSGMRRFQNVDIKYEAFFFNGLPRKTAAVKSWLLSPTGYCKLQDTYAPDFFRMGMCTSAVEFDVSRQKTAEMEMVFNCKPQRWSVEGQKPISLTASGEVLRNPFDFYSQPLISVQGAGEGVLSIGDYSVKIYSFSGEAVILNCETQNAYLSDGTFCNTSIYSEELPLWK